MFARSARIAAAAAFTVVALARPLAAQSCIVDYQRADNMWADFGRPDGNLGTETITLSPGTRRVFVTDWKYEKMRNDGTNFYGSHLRITTNRGSIPAYIEVVSGTLPLESMLNKVLTNVTALAWNRGRVNMPASTSRSYRADLAVVTCPNT